MNLLLLLEDERDSSGRALLLGRRARHAADVLRLSPGERLVVGELGGRIGTGEVLACAPDRLELQVVLDTPPPPPTGLSIILGMPRPKMLKRLLEAIASMGIERLVLLNTARVEKSYFDSPVLAPETIREHLLLGLEQGRGTRLPEVLIRNRFRPFVEDALDGLFSDHRRVVAHPGGAPLSRASDQSPCVVAIGPEGGFVPFEIELLSGLGFNLFALGPRILRVDTAVPFIVGQLQLARSLA